MAEEPRLRGRQAEAARNDEVILAAARTVFLRDPTAPMSAVAAEAGVGVGGLYRRFASKDDLLRTLCGNGLRQFVDLAEAALATRGDPWGSLERFLVGVVEADVHSLTVRLAGTFETTRELSHLAAHSSEVVAKVVARAHRRGGLRRDLAAEDLPMLFEQLAAVRVEDEERTRALRQRYLALHLAALRVDDPSLPGDPPNALELGERWRRG